MDSLIHIVRRTLASEIHLSRSTVTVVAVSGGADSVALLAALTAEGYNCVAAHCNFHLRGDESLRDMRFVENLTQRLGVDLYVKDFNVPAAMAETGESVEMACRRLRYEWFDELLTLLQAGDLAVGHHREDNVETFFLNLVRGTGIAGLTGISYRRGYVVRPLLDCTRQQIESYLQERDLKYVTDSTNAEDEYRRNRLRNHLLPYFEELIPGALDGVERTMSMLADARSIYDRSVAEAAARYGSPASGHIDIAAISENPDARVLLFELLRPCGFTMTQVRNMLSDPQRSGAIFKATGSAMCAELSRGILDISPCREDDNIEEYEISLDGDIHEPLEISVMRHDDVAGFRPDTSQSVLYLDATAFDGNPNWCLRRWRQADRMRPFGMTGSKLVSDIFSDAKMTAAQKRATWILTRNGRILWVVGVRTSGYYTMSRRSKSFVELRLL